MTGKSSRYKGVTLFRPTNKYRAQISAGGKTTSLGDHDTEDAAAVAFDRACINKAGREAKTNFPLSNYEHEIEALQAMSAVELVAMLRSRARRTGAQTSRFRGVSLLKQTSKWHAQINFSRRQVHLGFFPSEEAAARAYDRAAINKGAQDGSKVFTNFDISDYADELVLLRKLPLEELIRTMHGEGKRQDAYAMLASGLEGKVEGVLGAKFAASAKGNAQDRDAIARLQATTERAQPKMTERDSLYHQFGPHQHAEVAASGTQSSGSGRSQPLGRMHQDPELPLPKATAASAALTRGKPGEASPAAAASKFAKKVTKQRKPAKQPAKRPAARALFTKGAEQTAGSGEQAPAPAPGTPGRAKQAQAAPSPTKQRQPKAQPPAQRQAPPPQSPQQPPRRRQPEGAELSLLAGAGPPTPTPRRVRTPLVRVPAVPPPQVGGHGPVSTLEALAQAAAAGSSRQPQPQPPAAAAGPQLPVRSPADAAAAGKAAAAHSRQGSGAQGRGQDPGRQQSRAESGVSEGGGRRADGRQQQTAAEADGPRIWAEFDLRLMAGLAHYLRNVEFVAVSETGCQLGAAVSLALLIAALQQLQRQTLL